MRIPKSKSLYVSAATVLTLVGGTAAANGSVYKTVTVRDNGQRKVIKALSSGTLGTILESQGISVSPRDRVSPSLSSQVTDGMEVSIESPNRLTVVDGGVVAEYETFANTVGQFLSQEGITLNQGDQITQNIDATISDGETLVIHRKTVTVSKTNHSIPFQTIRQPTDKLFQGQTRTLTYGVEGLTEAEMTSVYVDGHKVGQTTSTKVVRHPVNQVLQIGTKSRPAVVSSRSDASVGLVAERITVVATAYVGGGGRTATGCAALPGVVAVDPKVIPLGTKLYIPGIGVVRAADTGGAIVGNRIDICMSSEAQAMNWGVRTITIYVLK